GLDTYIDDYSVPSPLAPEVVRQLVHARYLFSPPRTRINADGHVEDVPDEELPEATVAEDEAADAEAPAIGSADAAIAAADAGDRIDVPDVYDEPSDLPCLASDGHLLNAGATPVRTAAIPVHRDGKEPP